MGNEPQDAFMEAAPSLRPMVFLERFGGAVARIPDDATAFGHRDAEWDLIIASIWSDDAEQEAHVEWARSFFEAMQPYSTESVYVNYLSEEGDERVRAAYGGEPYARLVELKRTYDPGNASGTTRTSARTRADLCRVLHITAALCLKPRDRDREDLGPIIAA